MTQNISILTKRLGYTFQDTKLVNLALSHRSVGSTNNERLEFLGDSIVNFIIAEALFKKYPDCREGDLSQMRAQLVKGETLAEIAREFELGDFLHLGQGELKSGGFRRQSILADAVEALIGAIYTDSNMITCREHVLRWYNTRLQAISPEAIKDAKTSLQELLQSNKRALPIYRLLETSGNDHQQLFTIECEIEHISKRFKASGNNRRSAEQAAAKQALELLKQSI